MIKTEFSIRCHDHEVRAFLNGTKIQKRFVIKLPKDRGVWEAGTVGGGATKYANGTPAPEMPCIWNTTTGFTQVNSFLPGDRLWIKETFAKCEMQDGRQYAYRANGDQLGCMPWKPSSHMPREASRILLEVISIRAERLHHISESDAKAAGVDQMILDGETSFAGPQHPLGGRQWHPAAATAYKDLWSYTNPKTPWDTNPWVWVTDLQLITLPA